MPTRRYSRDGLSVSVVRVVDGRTVWHGNFRTLYDVLPARTAVRVEQVLRQYTPRALATRARTEHGN
jgi:hypothetical protein